jgi:3-hydroxyacyl-[acyl-carrier-protein] dehydratase
MRIEYFQLIDRIVDIDVGGGTIRTEAAVPQESTIFEGHFPGHPLMPGVLLIEAMAQTAGWLIIGVNKFAKMPFLAAVKDAKFRTFVTPGTVLSLNAKLLHEGSGYAMTKAAAVANGKAICDAEITFRVLAFPDPSMRKAMEEWATRIAFPVQALADG